MDLYFLYVLNLQIENDFENLKYFEIILNLTLSELNTLAILQHSLINFCNTSERWPDPVLENLWAFQVIEMPFSYPSDPGDSRSNTLDAKMLHNDSSNSEVPDIRVKTAFNGQIFITYIDHSISYERLTHEMREVNWSTRPVVIIIFAHVVRTSVPTFQI